MKRITITMTRDEALKKGLLTCGNCGWPTNNHFDDGKGASAHDSACKKYREVAVVGELVESK